MSRRRLLAASFALATLLVSPAADRDRVVDAPPELTGGCRAVGEVQLHPAGLRPASTIAAAASSSGWTPTGGSTR